MSETLTVQVGELTAKTGETNGKTWTRYALTDNNGTLIGSSFIAFEARPGSKLEVTREKKGDFWNITAVKPAAADAQVASSPQLGTGEYVKGKEAPETRAAIAAAVALKEAVNHSVHAEKPEMSYLLATAEGFFDWLMSKTQAAEPEKPAQGATDPSPEQRERLAEVLRKLSTHTPKQEGQPSWGEECATFANHTFGKTSGLNRDEFETLIGYAEGLAKQEAVPFF